MTVLKGSKFSVLLVAWGIVQRLIISELLFSLILRTSEEKSNALVSYLEEFLFLKTILNIFQS